MQGPLAPVSRGTQVLVVSVQAPPSATRQPRAEAGQTGGVTSALACAWQLPPVGWGGATLHEFCAPGAGTATVVHAWVSVVAAEVVHAAPAVQASERGHETPFGAWQPQVQVAGGATNCATWYSFVAGRNGAGQALFA